MTEGIKTEDKPMIDHIAWAKVIVDTEPDKDGWCFCRPANHPEDIELRGYEEWSDTNQFFGGVVAAPSYAEGYRAALRAVELEYERRGEDPLYAVQVADRMRELLKAVNQHHELVDALSALRDAVMDGLCNAGTPAYDKDAPARLDAAITEADRLLGRA